MIPLVRAAFSLWLLAACGRLDFDPYSSAIAWWPLDDDPASGTFRDASGHGHTARCNPGLTCPIRTTGRSAAPAAQFDGVTQMLEAGATGLEVPPPYTVALWLRLDASPGLFGAAISKPLGPGYDDTYSIFFNPGSNDVIYTSTPEDPVYGPAVQFSTWTHVVGMNDGVSRRVYVDGVLGGEQPSIPFDVDDHPLVIAGDLDGDMPAGSFPGALADVYIFGRALGDDDIAALAAR
jgi:hypothetical protein